MRGRWWKDENGVMHEGTTADVEYTADLYELAMYQREIGLKYEDLIQEPKFWVEFQNLITKFEVEQLEQKNGRK